VPARRSVDAPRWRWVALGLYASLAAVLTVLAADRGSAGADRLAPLVGLSFGVYGLFGVAFALRAWRHRALDRQTRRAWGLITIAYVLLLGSCVLRPAYPVGTAFPSPSDLLRLLFGPVLLAGLLVLPIRAQGRRERQKMWLDTGIVVIASGMLLWYLQLGPSATGSGGVSGSALAAAMAYPAVDLVLIFGACVVHFRGAAASGRQPATLLGVAVLLLTVGDMMLGYRQSRPGAMSADHWQFACWLTGHFLLAMAAFAQCRQAARHRLDTEASRARSAGGLPYAAIGLGFLLLLLAVRGLPVHVVGLVAGAIALTAVVVFRQIVALRENHELAITDTLTGLFNRRQLHDVLGRALARSARRGHTVAVLVVDLNDFKQANDTMGHAAGDRLLIAFGQILRRNVLGLDAVGRLGGDEFAVVLHDVRTPANARAVVQRIVADLQHPVLIGDVPVQPRASIGIALSGPGELTADELLDHADLAMYQAKATTRQTRVTGFAHYGAETLADAR
jgi:diguanylate cyclase (GGDEF)-like protein